MKRPNMYYVSVDGIELYYVKDSKDVKSRGFVYCYVFQGRGGENIAVVDDDFMRLSDDEKSVILLHEIGHIKYGHHTKTNRNLLDECLADSYAVKYMESKDKVISLLEKIMKHPRLKNSDLEIKARIEYVKSIRN